MTDPRPIIPRSPSPPDQSADRADLNRRLRIGVTGLGGVVAAILVVGAVVDRTAQDVMATAADGATTGNVADVADATVRPNDPLADIGAAPAAEPAAGSAAEQVPGTGAVVDPVTGNVSDLPPTPPTP